MDEAKHREDALKAEVLSFGKDNCALKEQKKSVSSRSHSLQFHLTNKCNCVVC